jgi:hypothetical protein
MFATLKKAAFTTQSLKANKEEPPEKRYALILQPFFIYANGEFTESYGSKHNEKIKRQVSDALQNKNCPPAITVRLLETVFDLSCEEALNLFIQREELPIRAITDQVKETFFISKKIILTLEDAGSVQIIKMSRTHNFAHDITQESSNVLLEKGMAPVLLNIIAGYLENEQEFTFTNLVNSTYTDGRDLKGLSSNEWGRIFFSASAQRKVHVLSFVFDYCRQNTVPESFSWKPDRRDGLTIEDLNLSKLNLPNLRINLPIVLKNASLTKTNLSGAKFKNLMFVDTPIRPSTNLPYAEFADSVFINSPIQRGADITYAKFLGMTFIHSPIERTVSLSGTSFNKVKLIKSPIHPAEPSQFSDLEADDESMETVPQSVSAKKIKKTELAEIASKAPL